MKTPQERAEDVEVAYFGATQEKGILRGLVAAAIREAQKEAVEEACRLAKGECEVDGAVLAEIREADGVRRRSFGYWQSTHPLKGDYVPQLLTYIDHLEARLVLLSQEEEGQAYARGFDEGRRAGWREARARCMEAVAGCREDMGDVAIDRRVSEEAPR